MDVCEWSIGMTYSNLQILFAIKPTFLHQLLLETRIDLDWQITYICHKNCSWLKRVFRRRWLKWCYQSGKSNGWIFLFELYQKDTRKIKSSRRINLSLGFLTDHNSPRNFFGNNGTILFKMCSSENIVNAWLTKDDTWVVTVYLIFLAHANKQDNIPIKVLSWLFVVICHVFLS